MQFSNARARIFKRIPRLSLFITQLEVSSMTLRTIGFLVRTPLECRIREHARGVRTTNKKLIGVSLLSFVLGAVLFATIGSRAHEQDDRAADREAIRAHIDSIFQAFIKKDSAALRATHAENWLGYLDNSGRMLKSINDYMDWNQ